MRRIDKILGLGFLVSLIALSCRKSVDSFVVNAAKNIKN
jgi:hypothetical protein